MTDPAASPLTEVLLVGGCSGVGKSSLALELHERLTAASIQHALIEGDYLDLAWPVPHERGLRLAEQNLAFMWAAYKRAGYTRLIFVNTVCVRADITPGIVEALGSDPTVHAVLLQASREAVHERLTGRERGSGLRSHVRRSDDMAPSLDMGTPPPVRRIDTTDLTVTELAQTVLADIGWR